MLRRQFLAALPLCGAPWVHAQGKSLTPLKFTLDFRVNGQTAPFFPVSYTHLTLPTILRV